MLRYGPEDTPWQLTHWAWHLCVFQCAKWQYLWGLKSTLGLKKLLSPVTGLAAHRCPSNSTLAFTLCHASSAEQRQKRVYTLLFFWRAVFGEPMERKWKRGIFHGIEANFQMLFCTSHFPPLGNGRSFNWFYYIVKNERAFWSFWVNYPFKWKFCSEITCIIPNLHAFLSSSQKMFS